MKKVLIVEDDEHLRRALNLRLRADGYQTFTARDLLSAVVAVRAHRPDVLLLDLGLPGGDGYAVMERVAHMADGATTPVIIITGQDPKVAWQRAERLGATALLQKPIDNCELLRLIREVTGEAGPVVDHVKKARRGFTRRAGRVKHP